MNAAGILLYLAKVSVFALVLWAIYRLVWRGRPLLQGSRLYLICSLLLPLGLPLIHLPVAEHSAVASYAITLPEVVVGDQANAPAASKFSWALPGLAVYLCGIAVLLLMYVRSYILLFRKLSLGRSQRCEGYTLLTNTGIGPGTIGKRIFFPASEVNATILRHELGHIRSSHRYDAALMQLLHIVMWVSPAHWLLRRELKLVHEYQADRAAVVDTDTSTYSELLLSHSLGIADTSAAITHSFFQHPLKLRITMLQLAQHPNRKRSIYVLASVLVILFSGAVVLAQTKKQKTGTRKPSATESVSSQTDTVVLEDVSTGKQETAVMDGQKPFTTKDTIIIEDPVTGKQVRKLVKAVNPAPEQDFKDAYIVNNADHDTITIEDPVTGKQRTYVSIKDEKTRMMSDGRAVYETVDQMPEFNGSMNSWLINNIKYPDAARKAGQKGRTGVQFVIDENGKVSEAKIVRSSGYRLLDQEALRIVNAMPYWQPGKLSGKPVPVLFTLPISFTLDK